MKLQRITYIPLLLVSLFTITSCNEESKIPLIYGTYTQSTATSLTYADLTYKMDNQDNFALAVIPSCGCVGSFEPVLNNYVKNKHTIIYTIIDTAFPEGAKTWGLSISSERPSFSLISNGVVTNKVQVYSDNNTRFFNDESSFATWMDENTYQPTAFYISLNEVNTRLKTTNQEFILCYTQSTCPDCTYINRHALKDYYVSNPTANAIYLLDVWVPGIRLNSEGVEDPVQWQEFKDTYGLSEKNNNKYGYSTGFVPTFQYIKTTGAIEPASYVQDASVFVNDAVSKDANGYYISRSFYTKERLANIKYANGIEKNVIQGLRLKDEEVNVYGETYYSWDHKYASVYHDPLFKAFITKYLPLL